MLACFNCGFQRVVMVYIGRAYVNYVYIGVADKLLFVFVSLFKSVAAYCFLRVFKVGTAYAFYTSFKRKLGVKIFQIFYGVCVSFSHTAKAYYANVHSNHRRNKI